MLLHRGGWSKRRRMRSACRPMQLPQGGEGNLKKNDEGRRPMEFGTQPKGGERGGPPLTPAIPHRIVFTLLTGLLSAAGRRNTVRIAAQAGELLVSALPFVALPPSQPLKAAKRTQTPPCVQLSHPSSLWRAVEAQGQGGATEHRILQRLSHPRSVKVCGFIA
ncbi:hypothetical protein Esti_001432 [Eimeria stiedai]